MIASAQLQRFVFFVSVMLVPVGAWAADVRDVASVPSSASVSRGDFIRAAIQTLDIASPRNVAIRYRTPIPTKLKPFVNTASALGALDQFGSTLNLSQSISKGEALVIVMKLLKWEPKNTTIDFLDIPYGGDLIKAVSLALEREWMQPDSASEFGAANMLSGSETRALLAAIKQSRTQSAKPAAVGVSMTIRPAQKNRLPNEDMLRLVWQLLADQYLYQDKLDQEEIAYKLAESIVSSLNDPYSQFMRPASAKQFSDQLNGQVTGIGAQVDYREGTVTVVAPIAGSPAAKVGIKSGDKILSVDGVSIVNIGFAEAVAKIRGPIGSRVKIGIDRDGRIMDIVVVRDRIKVPEITVSYQGSIAVLQLSQFGKTTDRDLRGVIADIAATNPTGLVIDLRNNPGGLLHAATMTLSNFLPKGSTVAHIVSRANDSAEKTDEEPTLPDAVKMVVLINKGSASASEIVAATLQDAKRAIVVGEQSFGKGTVQTVIDFTDGSDLKMTIAEWLTPNRRKINGVGVTPDVLVPAVEGSRDEQMLRALDLLR